MPNVTASFPGIDTFPTSPVTSLPPDLWVIHMQKNMFKVRFGMCSSVAFQRAIARLCTSNKMLNVTNAFLYLIGVRRVFIAVGRTIDEKPSIQAAELLKLYFFIVYLARARVIFGLKNIEVK